MVGGENPLCGGVKRNGQLAVVTGVLTVQTKKRSSINGLPLMAAMLKVTKFLATPKAKAPDGI